MPQRLMVSDKSSTCDQRSSDVADKVGEGKDGQKGPPGIGTARTLPSLYLTVYAASAFSNDGYHFWILPLMKLVRSATSAL